MKKFIEVTKDGATILINPRYVLTIENILVKDDKNSIGTVSQSRITYAYGSALKTITVNQVTFDLKRQLEGLIHP